MTETEIQEALPDTAEETAFEAEWSFPGGEADAESEVFTLTHDGEELSLDRAKMTELAREGLAATALREENEALRALSAEHGRFRAALEELAVQQGKSIEELTHSGETAYRSRREASLEHFAKERSDVAAEDIPQSVWDEFHRSGDLSAAWAKHENALLRSQLAALRQEHTNARRATGSMASAGSPGAADAFDEGWNGAE